MSGDLIKAAKLWAKTSQKTQRTYLVGRWGGCRVLIFENADEGEGQPTHWLMLGDAEVGQPQQPQQPADQRPLPLERSAPPAGGNGRDADFGRAPAKPSASPVARGDGWRGSRYVRPREGAERARVADDTPFYDDSLEDIGR